MATQQHHDARAGAALEPAVADAITDAVRAAGFELEELTVQRAGRRRLVKVVVDARDDADGVDLDEVAKVSRMISAELDEREANSGAGSFAEGPYTLEVTSPGLDRPLTKPRHWRRAQLRKVEVRRTDGSTLAGRVGRSDADPAGGVELLVAGTLLRIGYAEIEHAVVEVEFRPPPEAELAELARHGAVAETESGEGSR